MKKVKVVKLSVDPEISLMTIGNVDKKNELLEKRGLRSVIKASQ